MRENGPPLMASQIRDLLKSAASALSFESPENGYLEAGILLAHCLHKPRSWLFAHPEAPVEVDVEARFSQLIYDRQQGAPVAYLTGEREFWSLPIRITRETLIPRPETELLVERALRKPLPADATVADLGTGSGAIAAALASERRYWKIIATDASDDALSVAGDNFLRLGLGNVECRPGSWFEAIQDERLNLIVSNPPYVAENDPHLHQGDVKAEPRRALASGPDGLDALREIITGAPEHLLDNGWLILEHGWDQGKIVRDLLRSSGYLSISTQKDLASIDRVTEASYQRR